ncbi:hypothetical protein R1flu_026939 [Riccia fluitans]|uniref:Uncharacterized protein n=1 Tax=Riccia fluitans TaxID=41844 RepID=A0ABD1XKE5_9MARC
MGVEEAIAAAVTLHNNGNRVDIVAAEKLEDKKKTDTDAVIDRKLKTMSAQQEEPPKPTKQQLEQKSVETVSSDHSSTTKAEPTEPSPSHSPPPATEEITTTRTEKQETPAAAASVPSDGIEKAKKTEEEENAESEKKSAYPLPSPESVATGLEEKETVKAVPLSETIAAASERGVAAEKSTSTSTPSLEKETENFSNINTLLLNDNEVATTLEAASQKLAAAHARDKKKNRSGLAKFLSALSPKRILIRFRDCYVNTCMMASERGDFGNLVAGHPGMFYASDNAMSRNSSQKRERDHDEVLASLSRQVSASLSRQASQANTRGSSPAFNRTASSGIGGLKRNASTGIPGLNRNSSAGIAGLNRSGSTGIPSLSRQASSGMNGGGYARNSSARRVPESELFKAGRSTFLESIAAKNSSPGFVPKKSQ